MRKTIIAWACALLASATLQASAPETPLYPHNIKASSIELPSEPCAGNFNVKFNLKYESGKFVPAQLSILTPGKKPSLSECKVTATSLTKSIPAGTYDFIVTYYISDPIFQYQDVQTNFYHPSYFVVKEGVKISADTELTFDVAEATNLVEFKAFAPDGKPYQHPVRRKRPDGKRELDYSEANIHFETLGHVVYHQQYGDFVGIYQATSHVTDEGGSIPASFNYYINDVSDNYRSTLVRLAISDKNEVYMISMAAKGIPDKPVTNSNFKKIEEKFIHTPAKEFYNRENGSKIDVWTYVRNYYLLKLDNLQEAENPVFYYSTSDEDMISNCDFLFQIQLKSFEKDEPLANSDKRDQLAITGPILNITQKGMAYENPANNYFTFPRDNFSGSIGDNVPLTMMVMHSVDANGSRSVQYAPSILGRYGEQIESSASRLDARISLEGKTVFEGPVSAINGWAVEFASDNHQKGNVTGQFVNSNIKVDGIPGVSTVTVNYNENRNDVCAPSAQMMSFTDAQGMPKNKFSATDDINVRISGGDPNGNGRTYSYMDARSFNLAYAPYATDRYTDAPLSVIRNATSSQNQTVYGATLSNITEKSSNGWYDVKISITDQEGNTSVQTISPAFKIEDNSGIDDIEASQRKAMSYRDGMLFVSDCDKVEIYGLDGRRILSAYGPSVSLDSLPAGIYIARSATSSLKILKN